VKIAIIAATERGRQFARRLSKALTTHDCVFADINDCVFTQFDALIYICAIGIAVRKIAPFVTSKLTDPAVVVCDETGKWAVSLLSGHIGGANELAKEVAACSGSTAVITTASDILELPKSPKNIIVGIGCRKGVNADTIERAVTIALYQNNISVYRVCAIASIDIKKDEPGLLKFAEIYKIPIIFFSAEELNALKGEFTTSDIVKHAVGVDNVCERCAVLLGGDGELIIKKTARHGVTVAAFQRNGV